MKPEILLVEDNEHLLPNYADELNRKGAYVRVAVNDDEAIRIFNRHVSTISAIVTDMRLHDGSSSSDHSGGEMARRIKKSVPDLPIYCISAFDESPDYPIFDRFFEKNTEHGPTSFLENLPTIVESARRYDSQRFAAVPEELHALKRKYQISDIDFVQLVGNRRLSELEETALLVYQSALENAEGLSELHQPMSTEGSAEVLFVSPDYAKLLGFDVDLKRPLPIVLQRLMFEPVPGEPETTPSVWMAELFGFPLIYTYADGKDEAIVHLIRLLFDYKQQIESGLPISRDGRNFDYIRFTAFLNMLFT